MSVASMPVSLLRPVPAPYARSPRVALGIVAVNLALGLAPAASCIGTLALSLLRGVPMRLAMLCGTFLWIANKVLAGALGGTALELVMAAVNGTTIWRAARAARVAQPA